MNQIKLYENKNKFWLALAEFTQSINSLSQDEIPHAYQFADDLVKVADELKDALRNDLVEHAEAHGDRVGDKGTREAAMGDKVVRIIPTRTGIDPKLLEAVMRHNGIDHTTHMTPYMTYKVDYDKVNALVNAGRLTLSQVESCRYPKAYRVQVRGPQGGSYNDD